MTEPTFLDYIFAVLELSRAVRENETLAGLRTAMAANPALDPEAFEQARRALRADVVLGWRPLADLERLEREAGAVRVSDLAYLRERADLARAALPELRRRYEAATAHLVALTRASARASRQQGADEDEIAEAALTLGAFLRAYGARGAGAGGEPFA
jgi:hypothetical protein